MIKRKKAGAGSRTSPRKNQTQLLFKTPLPPPTAASGSIRVRRRRRSHRRVGTRRACRWPRGLLIRIGLILIGRSRRRSRGLRVLLRGSIVVSVVVARRATAASAAAAPATAATTTAATTATASGTIAATSSTATTAMVSSRERLRFTHAPRGHGQQDYSHAKFPCHHSGPPELRLTARSGAQIESRTFPITG
jgi:hypothetical protein